MTWSSIYWEMEWVKEMWWGRGLFLVNDSAALDV